MPAPIDTLDLDCDVAPGESLREWRRRQQPASPRHHRLRRGALAATALAARLRGRRTRPRRARRASR